MQQILHRPRNEHFARHSYVGDPRPDMNGDPANVSVSEQAPRHRFRRRVRTGGVHPGDRCRRDPTTRSAGALAVAGQEYERYVEELRSLSDGDWQRETECPPWTVQDMAAHVLGQTESIASIREAAHQQRASAREGGNRLDGNAIQIRERAGLAPGEIIERLSAAAAASIRTRRRLPGLVRRIRVSVEPRERMRERWSFAYLMDVIYTRDTWMHRMDTARAVDAKAVLTPEHDGRIVADVVAEWARRHGEPFELVLEGPAGGSYRAGTSGERLNLDAVEFCRLLSGRDGGGEGLLATFTPF